MHKNITIALGAVLFLATELSLATSPVLAAPVKTPPFDVTVTLSDAAARKLQNSGETISISLLFYGEPRPGVETEDGNVTIADRKGTFTDAGFFRQGSITLKARDIKKITGSPKLNINVFTSRKTFENNLLNCGIFDDVISKIPANRPIVLPCKLIGEQ
jgi:hypothetical protein